jgi:hypothetical protein
VFAEEGFDVGEEVCGMILRAGCGFVCGERPGCGQGGREGDCEAAADGK